MKAIIIIVWALLAPLALEKPAIFKYDSKSYIKAENESKKSDKDILLYFTADWCMPCQVMKESIFSDPILGYQINENFITVSIDRDAPSASEYVRRHKVTRLPTFAIMSADGTILKRSEGAMARTNFYEFLGLEEKSISDFENGVIPKNYSHSHMTNANLASSDDGSFQPGRVDVNETTYEDLKSKSVNTIGKESSLSDEEINALINEISQEDKEVLLNEGHSDKSYSENVDVEVMTTYIQAGAFQNIDNADKLMDKLYKETEQVVIAVENNEGLNPNKFYKILLGPVDTEGDRTMYNEILSRHGITGFEVLK